MCTLGKTVVDELFGEGVDPIGKTVKIRGLNFRVLGVMKEKGASGWRNPDDQVFIPVSTAMKRVFGRDYLSSINAQAISSEAMEPAQAEIENLLRKQHKLPANKQLDFNVRNQTEFLETLEESGQTFTYMIMGIAIVSLIVGGIGIMNIMLVSVTERTREIGLRKAVGAKRHDILIQFLIEAMTLSIPRWSNWNWRWGIRVENGAINLGVADNHFADVHSGGVFRAAWIGVFFGAYPAWKAAKLSPIEALRHE